MSTLSSGTESDSQDDLSYENNFVEDSVGWNDGSEVDIYYEKFENSRVNNHLIRLANKKVPLSFFIKKFNIHLDQKYSETGWTHMGVCPFPDHTDDSPSFGFNSKEERFNCFGCQRSGKAVQFLAYLQGTSQTEVARSILKNSNYEFIIDEIEDYTDEEIDHVLFEYADFVRKFLETNNNSIHAFQYSELINWQLDVYLWNKKGSIPIDSLKARIDKMKKYINNYKAK